MTVYLYGVFENDIIHGARKTAGNTKLEPE
jgi:hypothetical protein